MIATFTKGLTTIHPADDEAERIVKRLGRGECVTVDIKRPRNLRFFRKYWVGMTIIADNLEGGYSKEEISDTVLILIGHCTTIQTKDEIVKSPKSISFASQSEDEFQSLWERVVECIVTKIIPGLDSQAFESEIASIIA